LTDNLLEVIHEVSREKGLDEETITKVVADSMVQAAQRKLPYLTVEGRIHPKTGKIELFHYKEVVEVVEDPHNEVSLLQAHEMDSEAAVGDEVEYQVSDREIDRIARSARQFIFANVNDAERDMVVDTFEKRIGEIITGTVLRTEANGRVALNFMNRTEAYLYWREQIPGERYNYGDHVKVYLMDVNNNPQRASQLSISRTHPGVLIKLFEMEVPEIYDGIVNIIHATRESGKRAKISVVSTDDDIDPVGACVGIRGSRVQTIVNELNGERVDIVRWAEDIETYARNALAPAEIESMTINEEKREIKVQVELGQLSLAIGRQGVNVRLASKLTGYKIDVGSSEPDRLSIEEQLDIGLEKIRLQREQEAAEEAGVAEVETTTEAEAAETPEAADAGATTEANIAAEDEAPETEAVETPEVETSEEVATTEANTTAEDEAPETEAVETPEAETSEEVATTEANTTAEDEAPETETAEIPEASAENNAVPAVEYALTPEQEPMAEDADEDATQADAPEQTPSA
jgi:N utilization substance protein A